MRRFLAGFCGVASMAGLWQPKLLHGLYAAPRIDDGAFGRDMAELAVRLRSGENSAALVKEMERRQNSRHKRERLAVVAHWGAVGFGQITALVMMLGLLGGAVGAVAIERETLAYGLVGALLGLQVLSLAFVLRRRPA